MRSTFSLFHFGWSACAHAHTDTHSVPHRQVFPAVQAGLLTVSITEPQACFCPAALSTLIYLPLMLWTTEEESSIVPQQPAPPINSQFFSSPPTAEVQIRQPPPFVCPRELLSRSSYHLRWMKIEKGAIMPCRAVFFPSYVQIDETLLCSSERSWKV